MVLGGLGVKDLLGVFSSSKSKIVPDLAAWPGPWGEFDFLQVCHFSDDEYYPNRISAT